MTFSHSLPTIFRCLPSLVIAACDPFSDHRGEFNAGPVDASNFPLPYKGDGGDPNVNGYRAGQGKFIEIRAFIKGANAGYYSFPFTTRQLTARDPLLLYPDKDPRTPNAYAFDPAPPSPFPSSQICTAPPNYRYDERTDDMPLNEQDNIFTQLPWAVERPGIASTFEYIPVVAEKAVSAGGMACQSIKSEKRLLKVLGNPPLTGNFLLWAIIDPSAGVYRVGQSSSRFLADGGLNPTYNRGSDVQKWGWFGQYYLAFIDGSYVPTDPATDTYGTPPTVHQIRRMKTQRLYIPFRITPEGGTCSGRTCQPGQVCVSNTCQSCTANRPTVADSCPAGERCCPSPQTCFNPGANGTCADFGNVGLGYDVLEFRRSDPLYSPVCEVRQYTAALTGTPPRPPRASELFKSADDIPQSPAPQAPTVESGIPPYIYCPQVD